MAYKHRMVSPDDLSRMDMAFLQGERLRFGDGVRLGGGVAAGFGVGWREGR